MCARGSRCLTFCALAALALGAAGGCEDPNEMFTGRWASVLPESSAGTDPFDGAPLLAIGHYGREVAGVAYFHQVQGGSSLEPGCRCAFIDHRGVDLDRSRLEFSSRFDVGELVGCSNPTRLDWSLTLQSSLTDDEREELLAAGASEDLLASLPFRMLRGTVKPANESSGGWAVALVRLSVELAESDRLCSRNEPAE